MGRIISICLLLIYGVSNFCSGQEEMSPIEKKQQTLVTEPITLYKGFFRVQASTYYGLIDKIFMDNKKQSLEGNIWGYNWGTAAYLQYGITDRFMAEVSIPYINDRIYQSFTYEIPLDPSEQYTYFTNGKVVAQGLGDMDVSLTYQVVTENSSRPAVALTVRATLPTGEKDVTNDETEETFSYNNPTGQGEVALYTSIRARKVSYPFAFGGGLSYTIKTEVDKVIEVGGPEVSYKNGNSANISAFCNTSLNDWIALRNFADIYFSQESEIDGVKTGESVWVVQYSPGFSFQLKRFRLDQFVSIPIKSNFASADPTYILILQYTF
jgi:hypothetical protein